MRMIDADALLTEIQKKEAEPSYQHTGEDWCVGLIIAEGLVDEQPTIEPQKWILCSERLPRMETDVLLQFSRNMSVGFLNQDNDWKIYSGGCWFTDILEGDLQPTAWQPLPDPWKGEEE